ncbi:hypothetical protein [Microbacterium kyungheense]|uniref:Uncharacterized protein n=1 Tax=Microbacterium kyungheense TaxID=1263636 RepID=A0A543EU68_9MICO|nr:hypothetical protein [Microbacterium kyungheense]TQM25109.1 hypothetical protein FB391_2568 [Microbacterium kyungheense]
MIDLDRVNIEQVNWAGERIRERHPLPPTGYLADLPRAECDAWIKTHNAMVKDYCGIIGALRSGNRAWLDVQLADGRWVGRWFDECASESAIHCVYSWGPIIAAGVGLKDSEAAAAARAAREASGDLLVLLGDDW